MRILKYGSKGGEVKLLQSLLNKKRRQYDGERIRVDGDFGPTTEEAVLAFQESVHSDVDGIVGRTTWRRLGLQVDINHRLNLIPQSTNMSCWAAAASMASRNNGGFTPSGNYNISNIGGLPLDAENVENFASSLGWECFHPQTWTVEGLSGLLRSSPVVCIGGGVGFDHAFVISSLWSDKSPQCTVIRIYDPWPVNIGKVYSRFYKGQATSGEVRYRDGSSGVFTILTKYILKPR